VGGDLVFSNPVGDDFRQRSFVERVADIRFVADHLDAVTGAGRFDRRRLGIYGHSLGGAAAAQAMAEDHRVRAGVNIDGAMLGSVIESGLDRPFATLLGDFPWEVYDGLGAFLSHMRAPHPLERFATTGHQAFTDIVWLVPQLGADPAAFNLGTVGAGEAVRSQRCFLRRFFAHALS
jgi:dienelactone hydrolase